MKFEAEQFNVTDPVKWMERSKTAAFKLDISTNYYEHALHVGVKVHYFRQKKKKKKKKKKKRKKSKPKKELDY